MEIASGEGVSWLIEESIEKLIICWDYANYIRIETDFDGISDVYLIEEEELNYGVRNGIN